MTEKTILQTKLAAAEAQLQGAKSKQASLASDLEAAELEQTRCLSQLRADPYPSQEFQVRLGKAKGQRNTVAYNHAETQRLVNGLQALVDRLSTAIGGPDALAAAKALWQTRSGEQVQAVKAVDVAVSELARLDAALAAEVEKTEAAQTAQRASILAAFGFGEKAPKTVKAAEAVLVGSAAAVDALRTARPSIEAKVAEAETAVASCDRATRSAEQDILSAKFAILDGDLMLKLEAAQGVVLAHHAARMAAGKGFGDRLALYPTPDEGPGAPGWYEAEADKLKALSAVGE